MAIFLSRFPGRRSKGAFRRALAAAAALLLACAALADGLYYQSRIYPGVCAAGSSLGGIAAAGAGPILDQMEMTFIGPAGKVTALPLRDLGIIVDKEQTLQGALAQGRQARWPLRYLERLRIGKKGVSVPLAYRLDGLPLLNSLAALEEALNSDPQEAYFTVCPYELAAALIPEKAGYRVVKEELIRRLLASLNRPGGKLSVEVPYTVIPAPVTALSYMEMGVKTLMVSFSTEFDLSNRNRAENLKIASAALDGTLLAPGEILSVNAAIGDTTPDKGYREAPVIMGGDIVQGFGGGLCQVSSTLYNAALLADLQVLERHPHQFIVPYLPPGRDATVEYGSRDLKIRNNQAHHILIQAHMAGNRLTFRLFGSPPVRKVEISTRQLSVIEPPVRIRYDPALPPGAEEVEEGSPGDVVEVWKAAYQTGREESRTLISVNHYTPYPTVIRRGP